MKFGRLLLEFLEQMPVEYRDKFLSYKQLKKVINTILRDNSLFVELPDDGEQATVEEVTAGDVEVAWPLAGKRARGSDGAAVVAGGGGEAAVVGKKRKADAAKEVVAVRGEEKELSPEEEDFLHLLNVELEKFNHFFTEKEEEYVIRLQELKQRLERLRLQNGAYVDQRDWNEDLMSIRTGLVTLHGEVVLMESYSTLNYTGLVKILKKHDKRTGAVLRLPFIKRVLLQPFFSTELLSQLVHHCEGLLSIFPPPPIEESIDEEPADGVGASQSEPQDPPYPTGNAAEGIFKSTLAALRTIHEMRKKSSTVSAQSLPPCNLNGNDERYGTVIDEVQMTSWGLKFTEHSKNQEPETMACAS